MSTPRTAGRALARWTALAFASALSAPGLAEEKTTALVDPLACLNHLMAPAGSTAEGLATDPSQVMQGTALCGALVDAIERDSPDAIRKLVFDQLLGSQAEDGSTFLRDLNLKPKLLDNGEGSTSLALTYRYKRDIALALAPTAHGMKGSGWKLSLTGTLAADEDVNSENFLDSSFSFSMVRETGGAAAAAHLFSDEYARQLAEYDMDAATKTEEELMTHPATAEMRRIQQLLGSQLYTALDLRAGLESDQSFNQKNHVYGFQLGVDYKSFSADSMAARLNVLDYPFALARFLTGYPGAESFAPSGIAFPTLLIGLDQVDPQGEDPRLALGEKGTYSRARAELAFRTPIFQTAAGTYKVTANARYYRELGASTAVENAGLDERFYVTAAIVAPNGVFVSYRSGDLPFDLKSQVVYELGFHTYFK